MAAGTFVPDVAHANKKLAKKMLKEASKLLKAGDADGAIARLSSAWELVPSAKIGKTLVSAYEKKGDSVAAAKFVEAIVVAKKPKKLVRWAKKKRKAYKKTLAKLKDKKAAVAAAAQAKAAKQAKQDAEAKRLADEEAKARSAARAKQKVKAAPAAATAAAKKKPKPTPAKKVEADKPVEEKPAPAAAAAPAAPEFDEDMESSYVPPPDATWTFFGYTAAGLAVASLGTGTFFLLRKNSRQDDANTCAADADVMGGRCAQATYRNLTSEMDSSFALELASWATAAVAAGASVALFTLAPPAQLTAASAISPPTLRLLLSPGGGFLAGSF